MRLWCSPTSILKRRLSGRCSGRHWNGGQVYVCIIPKRMIVVDEIYDQFIDRYSAGVAELRAGDPFDPKTTLAPLSSKGALDDIRSKIRAGRRARRDCDRGLCSRRFRLPGPSCSRRSSPMSRKTIRPAIGNSSVPVSMLFHAKDEEDAVRVANDSPYGLGGSEYLPPIPSTGRKWPAQFLRAWCSLTIRPWSRRTCPSGASVVPAMAVNSWTRNPRFRQRQVIDVVDINAAF